MTEVQDQKTFEAKVINLVAATRHLDVPQILVLRRMTLRDRESRRWATERQLSVVFSVILGKAFERIGLERIKDARKRNFEPLLPPPDGWHDEDIAVLTEVAEQVLGKRSEAETTQACFEALLAQDLIAAPPRTARPQAPAKDAAPLFAAQVGAQGRAAPAAAGDESAPKVIDFNALFDDTLCAYARSVIELFTIEDRSQQGQVPFLLAPEFPTAYEDVLRRYVLPAIRTSRHIQTLGTTYNWAEVGSAKLIEIMQAGEINNPILHNWDTRWNMMRPPKTAPGAKPAKKLAAEDNPWPLFREEGKRNDYQPPEPDDIQMLIDVIRFEVDAVSRCWREMRQLYQQEFAPSSRGEQAREGAYRDGVTKWSAKLPEHVGELLAIKGYFAFQRIDGFFMRRLLNNYGRSDAERRRNAPYLTAFVQTLPE